ncbi:UDP-N-acetylmuramate--L-alanine ligase, partial [Paenarthrobacter sp. CM16]|nr:UDP-N-acetylmuramate--L-alanine ligase [Paenarthrobacter sp. CM16]
YPAREDPIPGVTSALIADQLTTGRMVPAGEAVDALAAVAQDGDVILTVGAGDVTAYGPVIVEALGG